ncbi:MAG: transglycosylase domain-containing protein [Bacillota bacterium]|nr:transglycosylase domain-containing protein [Bacillota bacterium]
MKKKNKSQKRKKKIGKYILRAMLFILLLGLAACGYFFFSHRNDLAAANKEVQDKLAGISGDTFKRVSPTVIYDKNDKEISRLAARDYVYSEYKDIPDFLKYAFIATEDKDFFNHNGVSIKGLARAAYSFVKNKGKITQGGSTITQQLVKNVLLTQDRTWERKYTEIEISLQLEKRFKKEQILEYYINNINYSNGAYSAASAAKLYFNKPLNQLSIAEMVFIAAIPNNPTYYNPLKNFDHVIDRQHLMLLNMKEQNYITEAQYNEAVNQKITLDYQPVKTSPDNYMTTYALDCSVRAMMQFDGFEFKYKFSSDEERKEYETAYNEAYEDYDKKIRTGGYNIYTSFDIDKQNTLQASLDNGLKNFKDTDKKTGLYKVQGAAVCIDNKTGEVVAAVGGRTQKDVTNYFNRAFLAVRQPGSSIKPLLVYGPAFDNGYNPEDIMTDKYIPNGPKNSENAFFGDVTLRYAVELSLNTIPYQLITKLGIPNALDYLYKMNFSHIVEADKNPIISIGGFTNGTTPVEMAAGYSTLARGGEYIEPTCVRKITGSNGELLYENSGDRTRIYKEESTYKMTDVLKGVLATKGATGYGLALKNMPAAAKTGTTSETKDGWFAGYTPYLTTVVWVGADTPAVVPGLYGARYPGPIWKDFMDKANSDLEVKDFDVPISIINEQKVKDQTAVKAAEDAVEAYENIHINTKANYDTAAAALQAAQAAVDKTPADNKQGFLDRIAAKTDELNQEKKDFEAAGADTKSPAEGGSSTGNTSGTPSNNTSGTSNTNNSGGTSNTNKSGTADSSGSSAGGITSGNSSQTTGNQAGTVKSN